MNLNSDDPIIVRLKEPTIENLYFYNPTANAFNSNVRYLCKFNKIAVSTFYRLLNENGVHASIANVKNPAETRRKPISMLFVCTIARIFSVEPGDLLRPDFREIYEADKVG